MVNHNNKQFGACEFKVDTSLKTIEPRQEIRGDIARVYFYMEKQYASVYKIGEKQRKLLEVWNRQDPVSEEELRKNEWVKKVQGNSNPFVN